MANNRITVQLIGTSEDEGHVRLGAFITQLEAVKAALKQTERLITGEDDPSVYYRIVGLRYSSPASVVLEAVSSMGRESFVLRKKRRRTVKADHSQATVNRFFQSLNEIREKKQRPARADLQALKAYQNLAATLDKSVSGVKLINKRHAVDIDNRFRTAIDEIIGPDELFEGTVFGVLERLNLHNATRFDIFPLIGPKQVACEFGSALRNDVISAVDKYVCVSGKLRYKRLEKFPYAINAKGIDVLPPEQELPTMFDVKGMAPNLTEGRSIAEFLEVVRDDEGR